MNELNIEVTLYHTKLLEKKKRIKEMSNMFK